MNSQMLGRFSSVLMRALEPVVFLVAGIYAGMVYATFVRRPVALVPARLSSVNR